MVDMMWAGVDPSLLRVVPVENSTTDWILAGAALATLALLSLAAVLTSIQVKTQQKAREAQLLADLSVRWDSTPITTARRLANAPPSTPEALLAKMIELEEVNSPQYYELLKLPNFFEDLAILVDEGAISLRIVKKSLADPIKVYFRLYLEFVKAEQKEQAEEKNLPARMSTGRNCTTMYLRNNPCYLPFRSVIVCPPTWSIVQF